MKKIGTALTLALTLLTIGSMASAETQSSSLACGSAACTETWQFTCPSSKIAGATVRDTSGNDDLLMVTMIGTAPTKFKGAGESQIATSPGSPSSLAVVGDFFTNQATTISGFAIVTNLFNTGFAFYEIELFCVERDGPTHDPKVFKKIQDQ